MSFNELKSSKALPEPRRTGAPVPQGSAWAAGGTSRAPSMPLSGDRPLASPRP